MSLKDAAVGSCVLVWYDVCEFCEGGIYMEVVVDVVFGVAHIFN